jgi:hypothetical protein
MTTECSVREFDFQGLGKRTVTARFDGGAITSDAGGLLLREVEAKTGILRRFAACFTDHRNPDLVEHTVYELIAQRVYALALGYEDLNDHDALRHDPPETLEIGSLGADHGSSSMDFTLGKLSVSACVCPSVRESATVDVAAAGLVTTASSLQSRCFLKIEAWKICAATVPTGTKQPSIPPVATVISSRTPICLSSARPRM